MAKLGTVSLVVALLGLLAGAIWFAVHTWTSIEGPPMPAFGYVAMTLGVFFSLLVGFGLMALLFYSSRHGYDDIGYDNVGYQDVGYKDVGHKDVGYKDVGYKDVGYKDVGYKDVGYKDISHDAPRRSESDPG